MTQPRALAEEKVSRTDEFPLLAFRNFLAALGQQRFAGRAEQLRFFVRLVRRAHRREPIAVDGALVDVADEDQPAPLGRILVALVNADACVRRAKMAPIDNGWQAFARQVVDVTVGIRPSATLAIVLAPRRHVKEMMNHARAHERVAALIPIHTPRIARAVGEYLELLRDGM